MKKNYQKPMVMIENFELSQHIAACGYKVTNKTHILKEGCTATVEAPANFAANQCKPMANPGAFFSVANTKCSQAFEEECYASPSLGYGFVFGS